MQIRIKLVGAGRLRDRMRALGDRTGPAMATALEAAALPLENGWKENVRAYPLVLTGSYMRSIHHETGPAEAGRAVVLVGTDIVDPPYPKFLEFGTSRMSPKPTARPALDERGDEMRREFGSSMKQLLGSIG
ncbi:MAG TPA: HK97-gp10 family putative phage morphogenesis protein [Candidatus Limnocylindrales bacterium]|nr:HK97-gp10 family putative phage morphogenesis protein [Candidatus Limnocylindrales bacterium]